MQEARIVDQQEVQARLEDVRGFFPEWDWEKLDRYMEHQKVVELDGKFIINTFAPPFPSQAFQKLVTKNLEYPSATDIAITNQCHLICPSCNFTTTGKEDLATGQLIDIARQIKDLGVPLIAFSGGEPLMRPDLEEIIASVADDSTYTLLGTSGVGLTEERARSLKDAGLFYMMVGLDHHDKKKNDRLRFPGSYDAAMNGIENGLKAGLFTGPSITVTEDNLDNLETFIHEMGKIGVHGVRIHEVMPSGKCIDKPPLTPEQRNQIIKLHKKVTATPSLPQLTTLSYLEGPEMTGCGAGGVSHMYVDAQGMLRPCDFVPITFGDLTQKTVREVYEKMRRVFKRPDNKCFMVKHGRVIAKALNGRPVVHIDEVMELIEEIRTETAPAMHQES